MCDRVIHQEPALILASVQLIALDADEVRPSHNVKVIHYGYNFELST